MTWTKALTDEQERRLLVDHEDGVRVVVLAERYGVSKNTVYRILGDYQIKPTLGDKRRHRVTKRPKYNGPKKLQPCGTNAAYARHISKGERPCIPCADAHAAQQMEWKKRKGKS